MHKDYPKTLYVFGLVALLSSLSFLIAKLFAAPETHILAHTAFALLGWSVLTVFAFGVVDFLFMLALYSPVPARPTVTTEVAKNRRKAKLALIISTVMTVAGLVSAASEPAIVRTQIYLEKFPCAMNGFTIVQLSGLSFYFFLLFFYYYLSLSFLFPPPPFSANFFLQIHTWGTHFHDPNL